LPWQEGLFPWALKVEGHWLADDHPGAGRRTGRGEWPRLI